jgi:very-short-patch-repair endonuclease
VELRLAGLARGAHGVVTRSQLVGLGITAEEIKQRLRRGTLIRVHRGVYRVGHRAPSLEARYLAAVWACGRQAVLSGGSAAYLLGVLRGSMPAPEVTVPTTRRVTGVKVRRSRVDSKDATTWRNIPVTTVPRTLVDLARVLPVDDLARACHEAGVRHGTTPAMVEGVLARRPLSPGAAKLRRIMRGDAHVSLSRLESRFLERLRAAGLPLPQTNRPAGGRRVDCRWPEQRLTVELDSYRYHHSRHAWQQDHRREREARARGDDFRRYTWEDVVEQPQRMLSELRAVLPRVRAGSRASAARPSPRPAGGSPRRVR